MSLLEKKVVSKINEFLRITWFIKNIYILNMIEFSFNLGRKKFL